MTGKISFKEGDVVSIYLPGNPVSVYHYGGVRFTGNSPVEYNIVKNRQDYELYAYVVVLSDINKAVLFDEKPTYDKKENCYVTSGMCIPLDIEPSEIDPKFTSENLIVLHAI